MAKTLIRNGRILTMDPAIGDLDRGDVLIVDDKIAAVGRGLAAPGAREIDASERIVMPGLVNAHLHTWQTGIRGIAGDWTIGAYMRAMHADLATAFRPADINVANLVGALNQLNGGVTTILDWSHNNPTPAHTDAAIAGLKESGIRAVFGHGSPKPDPKAGAPHFSKIPHPRAEIDRLSKGPLADPDALVTLAMAVLGPHYAEWEVVRHDYLLARDYDLLASAHIGGGPGMNGRGVLRMSAEKLLGPKQNIVHGNSLTEDELKCCVDAGVTITATSEVEVQMGFGYPLITRLMRLGARPTLGIDIESGISGDMFTAMRMALQIHRAVENEAILRSGGTVDALWPSARDALEWATVNGAEALGLGRRIGSLTPGKQADVVLIRTDDLNLFPVHNPLQTVVFQAGAANVDAVFVAGRPAKERGRLLYPELARRMDELTRSGRRILEAAGFRRTAA